MKTLRITPLGGLCYQLKDDCYIYLTGIKPIVEFRSLRLINNNLESPGEEVLSLSDVLDKRDLFLRQLAINGIGSSPKKGKKTGASKSRKKKEPSMQKRLLDCPPDLLPALLKELGLTKD